MAKVSKALQKASKYVYLFGNGKADGDGSMKSLLGGKGANLAEMANLGLPVPPGFTITTEVCTYFYENDKTYPAALKDDDKRKLVRSLLTSHGDQSVRIADLSTKLRLTSQSRYTPNSTASELVGWRVARSGDCASTVRASPGAAGSK